MVQRSSLEAPTKDSKKVSYQQWSTIINKLKDEVYKIKTKNKQCNKQNYDEECEIVDERALKSSKNG